MSFAAKYGPWALVAGASEGLGEAFAVALAERRLNLLLLARRGELLEEVASRLRMQNRAEVRCEAFDLARPELGALLARLVGEYEIGLCVYNAAFAPIGPLLNRSLDDLLRVVDVNVRGPLVAARTLAPAMVARGRGGIVLVSSMAGFQGVPRLAAYAASKAFNTVLGEGLWGELAPHGVDVVVSCAGAVRTPGFESRKSADPPGTLAAHEVAGRTLDALGSVPSVVPGFTNRVARLVLGRLLSRRAAIGVMARSAKGFA